jgi:hypothetical protein
MDLCKTRIICSLYFSLVEFGIDLKLIAIVEMC